jgi:hypothetical protein
MLKLAETQLPQERTKLLRQMKVLIVEIDTTILSALRRDDQESSDRGPRDHPSTNA